MKYSDLDKYWQRLFELDYEALCEKSRAIAARDVHGGAMDLLEKSDFIKSKNISVEWMPQIYGDIQRAFQTIKELLYGKKDKLPSILEDFSVKNKAGVEAAKALVEEGWFKDKEPKDYSVEQIFNAIAERI